MDSIIRLFSHQINPFAAMSSDALRLEIALQQAGAVHYNEQQIRDMRTEAYDRNLFF